VLFGRSVFSSLPDSPKHLHVVLFLQTEPGHATRTQASPTQCSISHVPDRGEIFPPYLWPPIFPLACSLPTTGQNYLVSLRADAVLLSPDRTADSLGWNHVSSRLH
jgi:hypothetical protein